MKVTLAVCVFLMVFLGILAKRSMNVRDWSTNHTDAVLYKSKEQLGGTVKEVDGVRNRVKRGSQSENPKKDSRVLGYPRLIHPLPSGIPELSKISNDTSLSSTLRPQLHNPLYPLSESSISAYGVLLLSLVVFAVGIIGNLSVMCIVWHSLYLKSAWDSILAGLALWDFLLLFFCLPVVVFQEITSRRLLGWLSCRIVPYMEVSSLGVSTFSLCALGIDRFQSVTSLQPSPRPVERCQSILGKLAIIWLGSLTLALPETLLWQLTHERSHPGVVHDTCIMQPAPNLPPVLHSLILTYQQARMWWFLGCYFCLPLLFTTTSLLVTLRIIGASKDTRHSQCQRQLSWLVAALATVYGICTLPENITNILVTYTNLDIPRDLMTLITQFFLFLKCAVTPVLLLCLSKPLGQAFLDCCCCCCEDGDKPNSTTTEGKKQTEEPLTPSHCAKDLDLPLGTPC